MQLKRRIWCAVAAKSPEGQQRDCAPDPAPDALATPGVAPAHPQLWPRACIPVHVSPAIFWRGTNRSVNSGPCRVEVVRRKIRARTQPTSTEVRRIAPPADNVTLGTAWGFFPTPTPRWVCAKNRPLHHLGRKKSPPPPLNAGRRCRSALLTGVAAPSARSGSTIRGRRQAQVRDRGRRSEGGGRRDPGSISTSPPHPPPASVYIAPAPSPRALFSAQK